MAAFVPFQPNTGATAGKGVTLATGATNSSVNVVVSCTALATTVLVTNFGPNVAWVRLSGESSPTATSADVMMLGNTVRLFGNPVPLGNLGVAVIVSVTTSANQLNVSIGNGGA